MSVYTCSCGATANFYLKQASPDPTTSDRYLAVMPSLHQATRQAICRTCLADNVVHDRLWRTFIVEDVSIRTRVGVCQGHPNIESDNPDIFNGPIGGTFYCDGSCEQ